MITTWKKKVGIVLCMGLLLLASTAVAQQVSTITRIDTPTLVMDETIAVDILVNLENEQTIGGSLVVEYDSAVFGCLTVQKHGVFGTPGTEDCSSAAGSVQIVDLVNGFNSAVTLNGEHLLTTITFQVKAPADAATIQIAPSSQLFGYGMTNILAIRDNSATTAMQVLSVTTTPNEVLVNWQLEQAPATLVGMALELSQDAGETWQALGQVTDPDALVTGSYSYAWDTNILIPEVEYIVQASLIFEGEEASVEVTSLTTEPGQVPEPSTGLLLGLGALVLLGFKRKGILKRLRKKQLLGFIIFGLLLMLGVSLLFADFGYAATPTYNWAETIVSPLARSKHAMAQIDGAKVLLFGGSDGTSSLNDTWVYDRSTNVWTQKFPATSPPARHAFGMAYIGAKKVLLFGGRFASGVFYDDTWIYDLSTNTWTEMNPATFPSQRYRHAMAYLGDGGAGVHQVMLFGGVAIPGGQQSDTWVYDLNSNTWTQELIAGPTARERFAMAKLDELDVNGNVLLFGGNAAGVLQQDTWAYTRGTPGSWANKVPGGPVPAARYRHAMAYCNSDRAMLFGGRDAISPAGSRLNETWYYDLSLNQWTQQAIASPSAREFTAIAYSNGDKTVLFGGSTGSLSNETWSYERNPAAWDGPKPGSPAPPKRDWHAMAFNGGKRVLLFGGNDQGSPPGTPYLGDTWFYNRANNRWTQQVIAGSPTARVGHSMAYTNGKYTILFGGRDSGGLKNDTWLYTFDAATPTWTPRALGPLAREYAAMAWISGDRALLFGGDNAGALQDTWLYDRSANSWTQKFPATSPPARLKHAMAYIGDDKVLLFGGDDGAGGYRGDTWVYDLSDDDWTQLTPPTAPSARLGHGIAYLVDDQVLLFGGDDVGPGYLNDTWHYDLSENTWTNLTPANMPPARGQYPLARMDNANVLLFGGYDGTDQRSDTWLTDSVFSIRSDGGESTALVTVEEGATDVTTVIASGGEGPANLYTITGGADQALFAINGTTGELTFVTSAPPVSSPGDADSNNQYEVTVQAQNAIGEIDKQAITVVVAKALTKQQTPATSPTGRDRHAMADFGGNDVLLFGGYDGTSILGDTWVYDLSTGNWTQKTPSPAPPTLQRHAMTHILANDGTELVLLQGGHDGSRRQKKTWTYNLATDTWIDKRPANAPKNGRQDHALAYIGSDRVLMFGGNDGSLKNDSWIYDLSRNTWKQVGWDAPIPPLPSARWRHAMAHIGGNKVLMFGGNNGALQGDTWIFERLPYGNEADYARGTWTNQNPPGLVPSARDRHSMVYIGSQQVVLFGGDDGGRDDEMWIYDLKTNTWTQLPEISTWPNGRFYHAISRIGNNQVLMFAGNVGGATPRSNDTWLLYPAAANLTTSTVPQAGFPVAGLSTASGFGMTSPVLGDVDGDGRLDIVFANNNVISAVPDSGVAATPVITIAPANFFTAAPVLVDEDADGDYEVFAVDDVGTVYGVECTGGCAPPFINVPTGVGGSSTSPLATPAVGDIDGNGVMNELAWTFVDAAGIPYIGVIDVVTGAFLPPGPTAIGPGTGGSLPRTTSVAVMDVDGDVNQEIFVGYNDNVAAPNTRGHIAKIEWTGAALGPPTATFDLPLGVTIGSGGTFGLVNSAPSLGDLDNNGTIELVVGASDGIVYVASAASLGPVAMAGLYAGAGGAMSAAPAISDLDGNGTLDVIVGDVNGRVYAFDGAGTDLTGWGGGLNIGGGTIVVSPTVGDVDSDDQLEVVVGQMNSGKIFVINPDGTYEQGLNDAIGTVNSLNGTIAIGDVDRDGDYELVTGDAGNVLYAWDAADGRRATATLLSWNYHRHNAHRAGSITTVNFEPLYPVITNTWNPTTRVWNFSMNFKNTGTGNAQNIGVRMVGYNSCVVVNTDLAPPVAAVNAGNTALFGPFEVDFLTGACPTNQLIMYFDITFEDTAGSEYLIHR